jgi:hypothetical protein
MVFLLHGAGDGPHNTIISPAAAVVFWGHFRPRQTMVKKRIEKARCLFTPKI